MTPQEKLLVQLETRMECARIAAAESHYWGGVEADEKHLSDICIGAIGAAANICGALFMGKSLEEVQKEIELRGDPTALRKFKQADRPESPSGAATSAEESPKSSMPESGVERSDRS